jgi:hypothetical protein
MTAGTSPQMTVHWQHSRRVQLGTGRGPTSDWLDLGYERGRISHTALDIP